MKKLHQMISSNCWHHGMTGRLTGYHCHFVVSLCLSEVEIVIENIVTRQSPVSRLHVEDSRPGFLVVAVMISRAAS